MEFTTRRMLEQNILTLITDINSRYDSAVAQSVINRNDGSLATMGSIELEQALDDLLTIANERD